MGMETGAVVAYRMETAHLDMRCLSPQHAPALRTLLDEADSWLRPWIPWMKDEPQSLAGTVQRLREYRADFDLDRAYRYAVFSQETFIGVTGLHDRVGARALEIGYMLHPSAAGKGHALEMVSALVKNAFELRKVERLEIHCDPRNVPSAKLPAKLGFTNEAILKRRYTNSEGEICDDMVWTLFREQYLHSPVKEQQLAAFDVLENRIL